MARLALLLEPSSATPIERLPRRCEREQASGIKAGKEVMPGDKRWRNCRGFDWKKK